MHNSNKAIARHSQFVGRVGKSALLKISQRQLEFWCLGGLRINLWEGGGERVIIKGLMMVVAIHALRRYIG